MLGLPEYGEQQIAIMMGGPERDEFFAQGGAVARRADRRRDRRTEPGDAHSGRPGQRRRHRAGLPAVRRARVLLSRAGRRFSARGRAFSRFTKDAPLGQHRPGRHVRSLGDRCPSAGLKVLDLSTFWAGAYLTCYLGAFGADIVKVESIQRPDGFRYSGAFPFEGDDWYERSATMAGHQPQQARPHPRPDLGAGPRHRSPAGRAGRRRRGELLAARGRALRPGLRVAGGAEPRRDHGADAGLRPAGAVAGLRRLGAELRADLGDVGGHRLPRRSAVQPAGTRGSRSWVYTPASPCWPRSSTAAAPARAN